jgi:hypothetical protein
MPEVHHHDPTVAAHDSRADLAHDQPAANQHPGDHAQARHAGHDKHADHDPEMFRRRFWLSLLFRSTKENNPGRRSGDDGTRTHDPLLAKQVL